VDVDREAIARFIGRYNRVGYYYDNLRMPSEELLPSYYGSAFHSLSYVEALWLPGRFRLKAYLPVAALSLQDILVMQKL
jgi:hypothetical protein